MLALKPFEHSVPHLSITGFAQHPFIFCGPNVGQMLKPFKRVFGITLQSILSGIIATLMRSIFDLNGRTLSYQYHINEIVITKEISIELLDNDCKR